MDLYTIEIKKYKKIFFQTQISNAIIVFGTFVLLKNGVYILAGFDPGKKLTLPILFAMTILAGIHTQYLKKQIEKLQSIPDFGDRVERHEKLYKTRLLWFLFACVISCFLAILTGRYLFFYFGLLDILFSLPYYPNLSIFKRELNNDEIMIY